MPDRAFDPPATYPSQDRRQEPRQDPSVIASSIRRRGVRAAGLRGRAAKTVHANGLAWSGSVAMKKRAIPFNTVEVSRRLRPSAFEGRLGGDFPAGLGCAERGHGRKLGTCRRIDHQDAFAAVRVDPRIPDVRAFDQLRPILERSGSIERPFERECSSSATAEPLRSRNGGGRPCSDNPIAPSRSAMPKSSRRDMECRPRAVRPACPASKVQDQVSLDGGGGQAIRGPWGAYRGKAIGSVRWRLRP